MPSSPNRTGASSENRLRLSRDRSLEGNEFHRCRPAVVRAWRHHCVGRAQSARADVGDELTVVGALSNRDSGRPGQRPWIGLITRAAGAVQGRLLGGMKANCLHSIQVSQLQLQLPSPPLDNIRVVVIAWRLRGNIIRTAPCWVVWRNVHSQQHTHMSSSYRSSRLGLSHWDLTL